MAQKKDKTRKDKVEKFKDNAKQQAAQAAIPKTHLIPQTNWNTTDVLDLRGDLLEALEKQMVLVYQNLQAANDEFNKAAQVMQMIMSTNVKSGKINLTYSWNNGEKATEQEVEDFKAKMKEIQELRNKQVQDLKRTENAAKTGLVAADGSTPIGSTQNLDEEVDNQTNEE